MGPVRLIGTGDLTVTPAAVVSEVYQPAPLLNADLFVSAWTPGVEAPLGKAERGIVVIADTGRDLLDQLLAIDPMGSVASNGNDDYDLMAGLRAIVSIIAAVILAVGLLSCGIAAVNRTIARRRGVVSLQPLGISPSLLRRAQWLEAVRPTALGSLVAVAAGLFAGSTYFAPYQASISVPWSQALVLAGASLLASVVVAGVAAAVTNRELTPDVVRAE